MTLSIRITVTAFLLLLLYSSSPTSAASARNAEEKAVSADFLEWVKNRAQLIDQDEAGRLPQLDRNPVIDGMLEEDVWKQAVVWKLPWEINRGENRPSPDNNYVLMASHGPNLNLAYISFDQSPDRIRGTLTDRDSWNSSNNDAAGFFLDTFGDGRNAYLIMVNAAGVQADAMMLDRGAQGTEDDSSFDFLWHSDIRRFEDGYVAEITIPLSDLQIPDTGEPLLEMNILPFRIQPRDFLRHLVPVEWDFDRSCFICQFPSIRIENPGRISTPVQLVPYTSGFAEAAGPGTNLTDHPADYTGSVGIDMKYQTTSSVIDATILPDFSQVETDAFEMTSNVRFVPRFPERRPFFMERTDLFRFPISQTLYTRSIVDPTGGLRWTGKTGRHNWAAISMHDQTGWFIDPGPHTSRLIVDGGTSSWNNLMRYRYDVSPGVMMGVFYSDRITEDGYNRLLSYDAQIGIGSKHTLVLQPLASWNRYPDRFGEQHGVSTDPAFDYGYLVRMARSGRSWDYRVETRRYGRDLITGTGILQQTDVQHVVAWSGYNFWLDNRYIERIRPGFRTVGTWHLHGGDLGTLFRDPDPLSLSGEISVSVYGINRSRVQLEANYDYEYVEDILGNGLESRDFDLYRFSGLFNTDITTDYRISIRGSYGSAVDYRLIERMDEYRLSLYNSLFLLDRRVDVSHSMDFMRLSHDVVAQKAMTQRLSAQWQITRSLAFRNIMQYRNFRFSEPRYADNVPDRVQTLQNQVLLRYRINYATAIYLGGFAELGEVAPRTGFERVEEQSQWQVFAKISWLI
ncbi:MAG: DUF5916 domain-containing protein [Cyclonatronaceae bacterium]